MRVDHDEDKDENESVSEVIQSGILHRRRTQGESVFLSTSPFHHLFSSAENMIFRSPASISTAKTSRLLTSQESDRALVSVGLCQDSV